MPMGFMASRGQFHESGNYSQWLNQKHPSFTRSVFSDNTKWETVDVCMSVDEESIMNTTGMVNAPLECWGCNNSSIYHADRFHTY